MHGELRDGLLLRLPVLAAVRLLEPDCAALNALGRHFAFEAAVGVNGAVWVRAAAVEDTIVLRNCLLACAGLEDHLCIAFVDQVAAHLGKPKLK